LQPALLDDELELATSASDVTDESFMRHTTITRVSDGTLLAQVHSAYGWLDLATEKPVGVPAALTIDLTPNIAA
jgi:acyl-CoA thioesterase FadM